MDETELRRVVYFDSDYPTGWVHSPELIAGHLAERHGFVVLDAGRVGSWMLRQAASGRAPGSVCVLAMGMAPDTVAQRPSASCTVRRYLDAGGRVVWIGDVPFYWQGRRGVRKKHWGDAGMAGILQVQNYWSASGRPAPTEEGRAWGIFLADESERCVPADAVVSLTRIGDKAASWRKVFNPTHPQQGFVRYRGGALGASQWNAKCNELYRVALHGLEEPLRVPLGWDDPARAGLDRTVFSDPRYPTSRSQEAQTAAAALAERHGFSPLDADALASWMRAKVAAGAAGSVCVILHGVAPDTVYDQVSPLCLARRYMAAGGRLVWAGDVPFLYRGRRDGGHDGNTDSGTHEAVLDLPVRQDWEVGAPPAITEAGKAWGMKTPDEALLCADASAVDAVLAGSGAHASTWLKTYSSLAPGSGFLRFRGGDFGGLAQVDELAGLALHALPPKPAPSRPSDAQPLPGALVGEGAFGVDRGRALDKLMRFMLASGELLILPLARAAAASGARTLSVVREGRDVLLEFEAGSLPVGLLEDPFSGIFGGGGEPAGRWMGLALLTALRSQAQDVRLRFAGRSLRIRSPVQFEASGWAGREGTAQVFIKGPRRLEAERLLPILVEVSPGLGLVLKGLGAPPPARAAKSPFEFPFDEGGVRGVLRIPESPSPASSLLFCVNGVGVGLQSIVLPEIQVEGWVNDDRLALNASHAGIVRDERWEAVRDSIRARAHEMVLKVIGELRASADFYQRKFEEGSGDLSCWAPQVAPSTPPSWRRTAALLVAPMPELKAAARAVRWLRDASRRLLRGLRADASDPVRTALWEAPLFFSVEGRLLSLKRLEMERRTDGAVRTSAVLRLGRKLDRPVVWLEAPSEADLLRRLFGAGVRDAAEELEAFRQGRKRARGAGLLERGGVAGVLARRAVPGLGEVGLRLSPVGVGGRLTALQRGRPAGFRSLPGSLRFEAVVEGPADDSACARIMEVVPELYRGLASAISCPVAFGAVGLLKRLGRKIRPASSSAGETAALEHLWNFLEWSRTPAGAPHREWAENLPLFETMSGWLTWADLDGLFRHEGYLLAADDIYSSRGCFSPVLKGRGAATRRLAALFPRRRELQLHRGSVLAWCRDPERLRCAHQSPHGCVIEGERGGRRVHAAVDQESRLVLIPLEGGEPEKVEPEDAPDLAWSAAESILLRVPGILYDRAHPWGRFVLSVARLLLSPWPGGSRIGPLREVLWGSAFPNAEGLTLREIDTELRTAFFLFHGKDSGREFDEDQLAMLRAFFPEDALRLATVDDIREFNKVRGPDALNRDTFGDFVAARASAQRSESRGPTVKDAAEGARSLLVELTGMRGLAHFFGDPERIKFEDGRGKTLLKQPTPGAWRVDKAHRRVAPVFEAPLPAGVMAAYLASIVHSGANLALAKLSDADDAKFQEALAEWAGRELT